MRLSTTAVLLVNTLVFLSHFGTTAFVIEAFRPSRFGRQGSSRCEQRRQYRQRQKRIRSQRCFVLASSATEEDVETATAQKREFSNELLSLLADKNEKSKNNKERIEAITRDLIRFEDNEYDPAECLFGPLYCTVYQFNPSDPAARDPLWERVSIFESNIKGQQYYRDDDSSQLPGCGSVINYSEILGPGFHLRAGGVFEPKTKTQQQQDDRADGDTTAGRSSSSSNVFPDFFNNLPWSNNKDGSSATATESESTLLRTCPDDYTVNVTKASIHVLGRQISLPIEGQGFLRVLYADPDLRIFISPVDTKSTDAITARAGGDNWESEGLVVVQVRSDFVRGDGTPLDLTARS